MMRIAVHSFLPANNGRSTTTSSALRVCGYIDDSTTFKTIAVYLLTDVPPQPNSPPDNVFHLDRPRRTLKLERGAEPRFQLME